MSGKYDNIAQLKAQYDATLQARGETQQRQDDAAMANLDALIAEDPEQRIVRLHAVTSECGTNDPLAEVADAADNVPAVEAAGTPGVIAQINQANQQDDSDELAKAIDTINQKHFITIEGNKVCIVREGWDYELGVNKLSYLSQDSFTLALRTKSVQVGNRLVGAATAWMSDPRRREYLEGIQLLPEEAAPDDVYNLWRGWGYVPVAGNHVPMLGFIRKVICNNDAVAYNYLTGWLARGVQQPKLQAEVAVVLKGVGGTGKGTLGRAFIKLFGTHGRHLLNSDHLKGHFNAHLRSALGVFADEAFFVGDKAGNEVLKGIITEPTFMITPKGIDSFSVVNRMKILMATNQAWAVPATANERRYFVLEVPETVKQNHEYFTKLNRYLYEQGGMAAWLDYLLKYDISNFDIRKVPTTAALVREKINSLGRFDAWVYDKLYRGTWSEHDETWDEQVPNDNIICDYSEYCRQKQDKFEKTDGTSVGMRLNTLFEVKGDKAVQRLTDKTTRTRRRYRIFPPLDQARRRFERSALGGSPGGWPVAFDDDNDANNDNDDDNVEVA